MTTSEAGPRPDLLTVAAVGAIAYALSNFLHEAVGHGGMCWLVGGTEMRVSTMHLACEGDLSVAGRKWLSAAGTLVNLATGAALWPVVRRWRWSDGWARYFAWLLMVVSFFVGGGYLMSFSFFRVGDWGKVPQGLPFEWGIRLGQVAIGVAISVWALRAGWHLLWPMLGPTAEARGCARRLCWVPYFVGAALALVAGVLNRDGGVGMILVSVAAAHLGGTFFLFGMPWWNRDLPSPGAAPAALARSWAWIAAAVVVTLVRVATLGPGITLRL